MSPRDYERSDSMSTDPLPEPDGLAGGSRSAPFRASSPDREPPSRNPHRETSSSLAKHHSPAVPAFGERSAGLSNIYHIHILLSYQRFRATTPPPRIPWRGRFAVLADGRRSPIYSPPLSRWERPRHFPRDGRHAKSSHAERGGTASPHAVDRYVESRTGGETRGVGHRGRTAFVHN